MDFYNDDARLSTDEEFISGLSARGMNEICSASGVPLQCDGKLVYTDDSDSHTLIFGNTGSKKTRNFCIPSVYTLASANETMVISDPKGEIYENTSGYLAEMGYRIQIINLRDPGSGSKWNPLALPFRYYKNGEEDKAIELITDFATQLKSRVHSERDRYWEEQAADLLVGIILILFECENDEEKVHMSSVEALRMHIHLQDTDGASNVFWELIESFPEDSLVRFKLASIYSLRRTDRTLPCILSTLDTMINVFTFNHKLMNMMNVSEVDFDRIAEEKTALFLIIPDEKLTYHFLVSVFVKQCYEQMIARAYASENRMLSRRLNFVLDEFSNFPKINDMPSMISAARSRNIRFILVVQSRQQLGALYQNDAETIKSNCRNWIFLTCREIELLREISDICGTVVINDRPRPLLSINRLQRLSIGWEDSEALILRGQLPPHIASVKDFSCYPQASIPPVIPERRTFSKAKIFSPSDYLYKKLKESITRRLHEF